MSENNKKKIKLIAIIMAKNEERQIGRCLESIKDIVDNLVIVDTGSTDKTIKIAEKYTEHIFHHEWQDDFSFHRNQTVKYAEEIFGIENVWLWQIDCDEEWMQFEGASKTLREFIEEMNVNKNCVAIATPLNDIQQNQKAMQFNVTRIFRAGGLSYSGIVHNKPSIIGEVALYAAGRLNHYGYDIDPFRQRIKTERRTRLLHKRIEQNPNDYEGYFYLNQDYTIKGNNEKAIEYGTEYIKHREQLGDKFRKSVYFSLVSSLLKENKQEETHTILAEGLKLYPDELDLNFVAVEYGVKYNNPHYISNGARTFLGLYQMHQNDPTLAGGSFIFNLTPDALGYCLFHLSHVLMEESMHSLNNVMNIRAIYTDNFYDTIKNESINFLSVLLENSKKMHDILINEEKKPSLENKDSKVVIK